MAQVHSIPVVRWAAPAGARDLRSGGGGETFENVLLATDAAATALWGSQAVIARSEAKWQSRGVSVGAAGSEIVALPGEGAAAGCILDHELRPRLAWAATAGPPQPGSGRRKSTRSRASSKSAPGLNEWSLPSPDKLHGSHPAPPPARDARPFPDGFRPQIAGAS